jgi:transcriptional regulator with XRE-family HTH domain
MTGIGPSATLTRVQLPAAPELERVPLVRQCVGEVLRRQRQLQGRTLREVSAAARVSLGYLSEVERGQKEASSELLAAICGALAVPLSHVLREVSDDLAAAEGLAPLRVHHTARVGDVVAAA